MSPVPDAAPDSTKRMEQPWVIVTGSILMRHAADGSCRSSAFRTGGRSRGGDRAGAVDYAPRVARCSGAATIGTQRAGSRMILSTCGDLPVAPIVSGRLATRQEQRA